MQVDHVGAAATAAPWLGNETGPQARLQCTYIYFIRKTQPSVNPDSVGSGSVGAVGRESDP
jgi:hypothetical protein